jgi:threonylcarbamoyladenosine tRNA methylthiotransferase MtaB
MYEGLTPNYIRVLSKGDNSLVGNIVETRLINMKDEYVIGDI